MTELPKNFPEYSLMFKTLNKKIQELKNKKDQIFNGNITVRKKSSDSRTSQLKNIR